MGSVAGETSGPEEVVRNDTQEARITERLNVKPLGEEDEAIVCLVVTLKILLV